MGSEYTPDEINRGPEPPGNLGVSGNVPPGNLGARGDVPPGNREAPGNVPPGNVGAPGNVPPGNVGARGNTPPKRGLMGKFQEAMDRLTGGRGRSTRNQSGNTRL